MTKQDWLMRRAQILTGKLTADDLQMFYDMFTEQCVAHYRTIDFKTFLHAFTQWFNSPISIKNGMPIINSQNNIVNSMINYYDAKYHVVYLFNKDKQIIKVF